MQWEQDKKDLSTALILFRGFSPTNCPVKENIRKKIFDEYLEYRFNRPNAQFIRYFLERILDNAN